jgi:hypothetical protein
MLGTQGSAAPTGDFAPFTPEQALMKQLALGGQTRRAGFVAKSVKTMPVIDPAPPETQPACSQKAMDWLFLVANNGSTRELAFDWFILIQGRGKRVPLKSLATVLDFSNRHPTWVPYIAPVIGARGRWLVEKTNVYPNLQQENLWRKTGRPELRPTEINSNYTKILELHTQMMEELARE